MKKRRKTNLRQIYVLIASHFDEQIVAIFLDQLQSMEIPVSLVGLTKGVVAGKYGLLAQPDFQIDEVGNENKVCLLLVPGDDQCASALMIDPRFHRMIHKTLVVGGMVAVATGAQKILHEGSLPILGTPGFQFLKQGRQEDLDFIKQLVNRIV